MKNRFFLFTSILIFLFIFSIFYKSLHKTNIYTPNVKLDKMIPEYSTKVLDTDKIISYSEIFDTEDFYFLNIWSSWCIPCRDEHNLLMELSKNKDIKLVGLNYKDNIKNAQKFLKELGNPFNIILVDIDGIQAIEWGAVGVPESFVIHKKKIIKKYIGPLDENLLIQIKSLIK
jgi:cytochrome c biogenesis protein CcmG/thiol:disulfide interchange protein DsbE